VVGGSFFEEVPAADVYVLSAVLHDWSDDTCTRILRTIGAAAKPNARLVLFETVLPQDYSPHYTKFVDLVMMAMLGGRERTEAEWRYLLAGAGFRLDRIVPGSAMHAAMPRSTFATRFRALSGEPPLTYLHRWRIRLAQAALRDTDATVTALASDLGYASESSFSHAFTRSAGVSPRHYRTLHRGVRPARTGRVVVSR
jgi:hypothetical protein